MKSLSLIFFTLSIVCIIIGYMELKIINKKKQKTIEYRFVPREIIETQFNQINLEKSFKDLFNSSSPLENNLI
tara:strand:+ start:911 stop:1129 length:219 start_codon:yes stop_codon:yes gene_type:complete